MIDWTASFKSIFDFRLKYRNNNIFKEDFPDLGNFP